MRHARSNPCRGSFRAADHNKQFRGNEGFGTKAADPAAAPSKTGQLTEVFAIVSIYNWKCLQLKVSAIGSVCNWKSLQLEVLATGSLWD
jgi:hypothetical protein